LLHELVHIRDILTGSFGNTFAAAAIYQVRIAPFCGGHGIDHSFYAFEGIIADIEVFYRFTDPWDHAQQVLDATHLLDLL
jgi:hypothetical protein